VILVMLGTHPQPMDRVVRAMDELVADGRIAEPVVVQAAAFGRRPEHATAIGIVPAAELQALIRDARVVVTHGGPGSIMDVIAAGRRPVVVPRDPAHGEHVDDHQIRFARWLEGQRPRIVAVSVDERADCIDAAGSGGADPAPAAPDPALVRRLRALVEASARPPR
jgi:UDP-N-acetylglucosamine transferase subunit ALG13